MALTCFSVNYSQSLLGQTSVAPSVVPEAVVADPPPLGRRAVLGQRWTELAYFHWPYEPAVVQSLLPHGVRVDTFDGAAWVGLIPFVMRDVRIGPTPPVPHLGTFVEVNVRTYVVDPRGRRAVWFFTLDVPRSVIVAVARSVFALPYCWAHTRFVSDGAHRSYRVDRRWPRTARSAGRPSAEIDFTIGEPIADVSDLDHFLTARWALLTNRRRRLLYGRVHHERWPLHHIDQWRLDGDLVEAAGLPSPDGAPRTACSPGVDVTVGWLETAGRSGAEDPVDGDQRSSTDDRIGRSDGRHTESDPASALVERADPVLRRG